MLGNSDFRKGKAEAVRLMEKYLMDIEERCRIAAGFMEKHDYPMELEHYKRLEQKIYLIRTELKRLIGTK